MTQKQAEERLEDYKRSVQLALKGRMPPEVVEVQRQQVAKYEAIVAKFKEKSC